MNDAAPAEQPSPLRQPASLHRYRAFGLVLASRRELPELPEVDPGAAVDVEILDGPLGPPDLDSGGEGVGHREAADRSLYHKRGVGVFAVEAGRRIVIDEVADVDPRAVRLGILGPAMAMVLEQRGLLLLHGSGTAIDGRAALFVGPNSCGKSSLAAALCGLGHPLLTDDLAAIDTRGSAPAVIPAFPYMKLWPHDRERSPRFTSCTPVHPDVDKLGFRLAEATPDQPVPLARIYLLQPGDSIELGDLGRQSAFRSLLGRLYAVRFGDRFLRDLDPARLLAQGSQVLRRASMRVLTRPPQDAPPERLADVVLADMRS
jgi:energy-coupling factor transporter ATP-binding protein EcfA2